MSHTTNDRRHFIKQGLIGTAGLTLGTLGTSARSYAAVQGANDRLNVAVLGIRNQGTLHLQRLAALKDSHNVHVRTVCDVDERLFAPAVQLIEQKTGAAPATQWDLRRVFDDKAIDAVFIVVPNHWHALATVWASQACTHVYVEKPASHNIREGRLMIEARDRYKVRMQVGLNNRSDEHVREAIAFMRNGGIGELYMARALCFKARDSYGVASPGEPPAELHYDQWLGPAPWRPYSEKRGHYNWHWYWDTGNGDTGNTGPHQLDIARWGLAKQEHPVTVYSAGGIYGFRTQDGTPTPGRRVYGNVEAYGHDRTTQETPNTQTAVYTYADGTMLEMETRGRYTNHEGSRGQEVGNLFFGSDGWLEINGSTWKAFRHREREPFAGSKDGEAGGNHWANFIDAVRSGKDDALHSDIVEGHLSTTLCHLANISYRVGRSLTFKGDTERFVDAPEADAHLTREYRAPYVMPATI
jgi:predicted dehydrogenase